MNDIEHQYLLTKEQAHTFGRDGVLFLPNVLVAEALLRVQKAAERASERSGGFWFKIYLWRDDPDFRWCAMNSALPGVAAQLLGKRRLTLLYDQLFVKHPQDKATPWHNDLPYWPIEGSSVISIWIALSYVSQINGGLEFIRGSHLWQDKFETFSADYDVGQDIQLPAMQADDSKAIPDFDNLRNEFDIVSFDLNPGDAVAFHALTVHHALPNQTSTRSRAGYSLRFMGDDVRYREGLGMNEQVFNSSLTTGDKMESEQYPVVFSDY